MCYDRACIMLIIIKCGQSNQRHMLFHSWKQFICKLFEGTVWLRMWSDQGNKACQKVLVINPRICFFWSSYLGSSWPNDQLPELHKDYSTLSALSRLSVWLSLPTQQTHTHTYVCLSNQLRLHTYISYSRKSWWCKFSYKWLTPKKFCILIFAHMHQHIVLHHPPHN